MDPRPQTPLVLLLVASCASYGGGSHRPSAHTSTLPPAHATSSVPAYASESSLRAQDGPPSSEPASDESEALAKQLANPVASLVSVPFQANFDSGLGARNEGERFQLNVQPVVPFELNEDWNLISRTIVPIIDQSDLFPGGGSQSGVGDMIQSLFFSPATSDVIWGVGPVFLLPTASEDELGAGQWGIGPTGVVLTQSGPWTYGALANHISSFAGDGDRSGIDATFVQPFVSYTTPAAWTFSANLESTYDWRANDWIVPVNASASKVVRWGGQLLSVGGGLRYWAESPAGGPEGLGFRVSITLLFPKG